MWVKFRLYSYYNLIRKKAQCYMTAVVVKSNFHLQSKKWNTNIWNIWNEECDLREEIK